ncbi:MAG: aminoacyl-tRNA hydrolase [Anaerolineae bacterium]|nr:aminoacyl-tRNA hydrolase [Anaerolineae bacterium]
MIGVPPNVRIDESELHFDFIRASGPGGQNVNKVATSVQLRFDVHNSPSLEPDVKERLIRLASGRITEEGVLVIEAKRYRTQEQNRYDAIQRLAALIQKAQEKPKARKATRPSVTAKAARLGAKKKRGEIKRTRRYNPEMWEE